MTTDIQKSDGQAGHTPGPWQSQHDFDLAGEFTIVGNVDGEVIDGHTHHTYTTVAEIYDNDNLAEDRANARLIAAAPELLAALIGLEGILATAESNASGNPEWEAVSAKINAARAAIAKATTA